MRKCTMSSKSEKSGKSKSRRSFLPRLPSFRKKKTPPNTPSPQKSPCVGLSQEEPILGRITEVDNAVMRRSKTSELVATFEKRLSGLKDEDEKGTHILKQKSDDEEDTANGNDLKNKVTQKIKSPQPTVRSNKFSRFGFKGIAAHRISSFENRNNNGNGEKVITPEEKTAEEINSSLNNIHKPLGHRNRRDNSRDRSTDTIRSASTSSAKSPDSDCSSPGSMSATKVLGLPQPYRSVFSDDEPRGLKRQASSQSVDPLSSGVSTTSSTTPSPSLEARLAADRLLDTYPYRTHTLNSTFSLSEPKSLNATFTKQESHHDPFNATFTKDDALGIQSVTRDRTLSGGKDRTLLSKTKEKPVLSLSLDASPTASQQENQLSPVKETLISYSTELMPQQNQPTAAGIETRADQKVEQHMTGNPGVREGQDNNSTVAYQPHPCVGTDTQSDRPNLAIDTQNNIAVQQRQDSRVDTTATVTATGQQIIASTRSESGPSMVQANRPTMGNTQSSIEPNAISTPARPLHLSLKPHLSAIKHASFRASESFDSAELDSLGSDDLMCDSRNWGEDELFEHTGDESRLSRSAGSMGESVLMHSYPRQHNGWGNRNRTSSLDQVSGSIDASKRVNLSRGLSIPSPMGLTPRSKRRGNRPTSHSVSAVEELGSLIGTTFLSDRQQFGAHNTNRNRSNSSLTPATHTLRPPRWLNHQEDEDVVVVDAVVYRHMIQDITYLKTMLLRLKRALQQSETSSPFEHPLRSPFNSVPSSPMSDPYFIPGPDSTVADLTEENQVLRIEVKKLQELLVDKECHLNSLSKKLAKPDNKHTGTQCEDDAIPQPALAVLPPSSSSSSSNTSSLAPHKVVVVTSPASACCTDKCLQVDLPLNSHQCPQQQQPDQLNTRQQSFYEHQQQQQQQQMDQQLQQSDQQQQQELYQEQQKFPGGSFNQPQQQQSHPDVVDDVPSLEDPDDVDDYDYPDEDLHHMTHTYDESMTSSISSLTSDETRSSNRSLTLSSPTKRSEALSEADFDTRQHHQDVDFESSEQQQLNVEFDSKQHHQQEMNSDIESGQPVDVDTRQLQQLKQQEEMFIREQQHYKDISDDSSSENMQMTTTEHCEQEKTQEPTPTAGAAVKRSGIVSPSKLRGPSTHGPISANRGSPVKGRLTPETSQLKQQLPVCKESKQVLPKKKQTSRSRLVAPSSVSSKVLTGSKGGKSPAETVSVKGSRRSKDAFKKQTPVTEIETDATTSWEPLRDVTSSMKSKPVTIPSHKSSNLPTFGNTRSSIAPPTAYTSYQQKSGLRAPSQRVNQMSSSPGLQAPKTYLSTSGSSERLSDRPASPKRSSPQHSSSLRASLAQPVPSKVRTGLQSPKRARQIPMGVTQMQSQMAASSNQNKSPKRTINGSRRDVAVVKPVKSQEQIWEKQQVNGGGSGSPEHVMRGVMTSPQRQKPGSKIAIPVRGRGISKLPRTSIPARRIDPM